MTKRLISLFLAMIMIFSLILTSCANATDEEEEGEEEQQEDVLRKYVAVTVYGIADDSMTDEGLALVEEKISNYCVAKYKTAIDLRFFTEDQYQAGLNRVYDLFSAQEAEKLKADKEAQEAARSIAAYKASLSPEEQIGRAHV